MSQIKNVMSLFDGCSGAQIALDIANVSYQNYYACEIEPKSIKITQKNYPKTIQLGSVTEIKNIDWAQSKIDLVIGGSPCQGFSISGKRLNFEDSRSKLFFEYVRILNEIKLVNPDVKFLLENVGSMSNEIRDKINEILEVDAQNINSKLVSGQHRNRYYWTNLGNPVIKDENIKFSDILEESVNRKYYYSEKVLKRLDLTGISRTGKAGYKAKGIEVEKCPPIVARHHKGMQSQHYPVIKESDGFRKLTPLECERLQTYPDNYTEGLSDTQRFIMIGNGFTPKIIAEFLKLI